MKFLRNNEVKLEIPDAQLTIKENGSLWYKGMPILGIANAPDKDKITKLVKARRFSEIPDEYFVRKGDNKNGTFACPDAEWENHPVSIAKKQAAAEKAALAAKTVTISLSSRGWGDYSPLEIEIDITRPDCEIIADCRKALEEGHDVDRRDQSDEEILKKINTARQKLNAPAPQKTDRESAEREIQRKIKAGYCFSCESYCHGDCGNYSSDPATMYRRKLAEAAREANFGIRDN
jgi:hypothetical protein